MCVGICAYLYIYIYTWYPPMDPMYTYIYIYISLIRSEDAARRCVSSWFLVRCAVGPSFLSRSSRHELVFHFPGRSQEKASPRRKRTALGSKNQQYPKTRFPSMSLLEAPNVAVSTDITSKLISTFDLENLATPEQNSHLDPQTMYP